MSKHEQHNERRRDDGYLEQAEPSRHEEGSAWARTPEARAQEGVEAQAQAPVEDVRNDPASGGDSQASAAAPASVPPVVQSYDPYADARYDTYQHHQYDDYYLHDDYYLQDDYYYHDDYYPHAYGTYQQASHADYYRDTSSRYDYAGGQDHGAASSFTIPASAFVAAAPFARDYAQSFENTGANAAEYVAQPDQSFAPGAEVHLNAENSVIPIVYTYPLEAQANFSDAGAVLPPLSQTEQGTWSFTPSESPVYSGISQHAEGSVSPSINTAEQVNPELVYHLPSYVNKPEYPLTEGASSVLNSPGEAYAPAAHYAQWQAVQPILQEWHNHNNVIAGSQAPEPASPVYGSSERSYITESQAPSHASFLRDEMKAEDHAFVSSDAYHAAAQTREAEASSLVSDGQSAAVIGAAPVVAAYAQAHAGFRTSEENAAAAVLSEHMPAEQMQAWHSYLNGSNPTSEQVTSFEPGVGERSALMPEQALPLHSVQPHGHASGRVSSIVEGSVLNDTSMPVEDAVMDAASAMAVGNVLDDAIYYQLQNRSFLESQLAGEHQLPGSDSQTRLTVNQINHKDGPQNADGLLVEPAERRFQTEGFLLSAEGGANLPDARESLTERAAVDAVLLNGRDPEAHGRDGAGQGNSDAKGSDSKLKTAGAVAGAATLGVLGFAGHAAVKTGKTALSITELLVEQGLREDEDLKRVADASDIVHDTTDYLRKHAPSDGKGILKDEVMMERMLLDSESLAEKQLSLKNAGVREAPDTVEAEGLLAKRKDGKPDVLERDAALLTGRGEGEDDGAPSKEKRPVTKRERELAKKRAAKQAAKRDSKHHGKALEVVEEGGRLGAKGALVAGGLLKGSAKKVLSSQDEEIATAMTMVGKGKQAARGARTLVKLPVRAYHLTKTVALAVVNTVKSLWHGAVALATGGSGIWIPLAFLLFLLLAVVVIILGTATIVNEEQEISEITALVAELDEDLTEEINSLGAQPILYADANDTYRMKDKEGKSLTINADLGNEKSDLKEVVAATVTVQTNAEAVAAYIDAKYSGDWQVGAASWKYTVDAFGSSWNIIEWDDMPEWARDALNATDQIAFGMLLQEALKYYVDDVVGLNDLELSNEIAKGISTEMTRLIYGEQIQGINEEVITEVVKKTVKKHREDMDITDDQAKQIYYHMNEIITEMMAEYEPVAMVYDEVVELHKTLNFWSQEYKEFEDYSAGAAGGGLSASTGASDVSNKYGYPNSRGYDAVELAKWDGYNEVSVYGISEAGTTAVTANGTTITNTWNDTTMGIACEGLQNDVFAYWSPGYKAATGFNSNEPVKITLYNAETGKSVTAKVIDCGGWRGFNPAFSGMNADRQWDLLPAVWKALGGGTTAGTMHVYWRVDPDAVVGSATPDPITIEGYPWKHETDDKDDEIDITRPTYIAHGVQDLLNNEELLDEVMNKDSYPSEAVYKSVKSLVIGKVQGVMKTLLTMENSEGDTYVDYLYLRRNLADPFGKDKEGEPVQWVVTHRFNPGYEDFEHDDAYVEIKPLSDTKTVKAVLKGEVEEVKDGKVIVRSYIDSANSSKVEYSNLTDIKVEEGDEVKRGTTLGKMKGGKLRIKYYEINDAALQIETEKDWAYNAALFMRGFAGFADPDEPAAYAGPGGARSIEDCETIVDFAFSRLGCPYVWGATGPDTFDCSGLTQWCYAHAGISIPRNSEAQHDAGRIVSMSDLQPGDILWKPGHVGIYIGNNQYIHAPKPGDVVKISGNAKGYFTCGLRF